jgi:hypothetical protein
MQHVTEINGLTGTRILLEGLFPGGLLPKEQEAGVAGLAFATLCRFDV